MFRFANIILFMKLFIIRTLPSTVYQSLFTRLSQPLRPDSGPRPVPGRSARPDTRALGLTRCLARFHTLRAGTARGPLGFTPALLVLAAAVAFLFTGGLSSFGRGYYGGHTVAAAGPRGVAVAGPNGAVAVGRNGGVAVAGGYRPPVYNSGVKVAVGPGGVAVAGPNGAIAIRRSYAPCYPTGYISVMPVGYTTVYYGGYHCYFVGGVYYRPEFYCGSTVYVVVTP